MKTIKVNN